MGFWVYKIELCFDHEEKQHDVGITIGTNFSEAVKNIECYYKDDIQKILLVTPVTDTDATCATFSCDLLDQLIEDFENNNF